MQLPAELPSRDRRATCPRAYVTWEPRAGGPEEFYLKLGFRPTGERSGGQIVGVRDLRDHRQPGR
ncbi:hypothetical protein AWW66_08865 [Micromonospora rosaria]|uniref:N-acetyltransferase domain-containing protein n=1 Tax=Micromonospora rosaria TaxID=47874 RepID=A0A136PUY6_9ACTN|nr:hypothetical protein AWW66_08865 [Micromonospora rosaria]